MADAKCKGRESVCAEIGTFLFIPRYMVDVDRFVVRNTLGAQSSQPENGGICCGADIWCGCKTDTF